MSLGMKMSTNVSISKREGRKRREIDPGLLEYIVSSAQT